METTAWPQWAVHFLAMGLLTRRYSIVIRRLARYWFFIQLGVDRPVWRTALARSGPAIVDRRHLGFGTVLLAAALLTLTITPARAEPATTLSYPASASATRLSGPAFDTCAAPPLTTMQAWTSSPYDGVGVYIGGVNRSCASPISPPWVTAVSLQGWRIIRSTWARRVQQPAELGRFRSTAATLGTADAADAVLQAQALGMLPGSAIYGDMEHYSPWDGACRTAVLSYVSAWTKELHRLGYLSGMYANLTSGGKHLSGLHHPPMHARTQCGSRAGTPSTLTGWAGIPNAQWPNHQRGKQ